MHSDSHLSSLNSGGRSRRTRCSGPVCVTRDPASKRRECGFSGPAQSQSPPGDCAVGSDVNAFLQVHAYIISYLKKEMPSVFGKENKKKQLILKLPVIFAKIQLEHHISPGDFPDCQKMQVGGCSRQGGRVLMRVLGQSELCSQILSQKRGGCM